MSCAEVGGACGRHARSVTSDSLSSSYSVIGNSD